jgi:putative hydrolase of the HAD superfamily
MRFSDVLFDLDGTLYAGHAGLLPALGARIVTFIETRMGLDRVAAKRLCDELYERHGLTICGLRDEHGVDAEEYLAYVHDLDYEAHLAADAELNRRLAALPLRKSVFTNAPVGHATRVLERLGIAHHFDHVFDLHWSDWAPKPARATYERVLHWLDADPRRTIMVEDTARNLLPARTLGMTTIWVGAGQPADADHVARDTLDAVEIVARLAAS